MELYVWMGDRGCGHFVSLSVCRSSSIALAVMKSPANSTSEAEDITTLIIWARDRTGPLSPGIGSLSEQKMCEPTWMQERVSLRYAVSECAAKIMSLDL